MADRRERYGQVESDVQPKSNKSECRSETKIPLSGPNEMQRLFHRGLNSHKTSIFEKIATQVLHERAPFHIRS
jgi:hypothetical protein